MNNGEADWIIARIDAAIDRIEAVCMALPSGDPELQKRHNELKQAAATTLAQLDRLIAETEQGAV